MLQVYYHVIWTLLGSRFPLLLTLPSIPFISASMHLLPELIFWDFTHLTLQLCATPPMIFLLFGQAGFTPSHYLSTVISCTLVFIPISIGASVGPMYNIFRTSRTLHDLDDNMIISIYSCHRIFPR